jgi:metallo-beta-lactamase class B
MRPRVVAVFASGTHATFLRPLQAQKPLSRTRLRGDSPDSHPLNREKTLYYVGNRWVAAYLIDTGEGLILIDATMHHQVYLVFEGIRKLGFNPNSGGRCCLR